MKRYYLGDKEITETEAKKIEAQNQETLRSGTIAELLKMKFVKMVDEE